MREFLVRQGCESDFELVFGPEGVWPALLQPRSQGFLGTLLQKLEDSRYEVRDFWKSHWDFENFRSAYQSDIEQFRTWLVRKELIATETLRAAFYSDDPEDGDDAGLVQA